MPQIKFKYYWTDLVETWLRAVVRGWFNFLPSEWYGFTKYWIETLPEEDRVFIQFVFSEEYYYTSDGVACYPSDTKNHFAKREWLHTLEKKFAIDAGLILDWHSNEKHTNKTHV